MPLQQTSFENIVAKGENAHNEQFHILLQCFQLYSIIPLLFIDFLSIFDNMFSKSSAAELLYVEKVPNKCQIVAIKYRNSGHSQ